MRKDKCLAKDTRVANSPRIQ